MDNNNIVVTSEEYKKMSISEIGNIPNISLKLKHSRICPICKKHFETNIITKKYCSYECKAIRIHTYIRKVRYPFSKYKPCVICNYSLTTDIHHEGNKIYILCPNHHALITRGIRTLNQLLRLK